MRVRILKPMAGILDGISLSRFVVGDTYAVNPSLGVQLIAIGGATLMPQPPPVALNQHTPLTDDQLVGGVTVVQNNEAEDRKARQRRS